MKDLRILVDMKLANGHAAGYGHEVASAGSQARFTIRTIGDGESLEEREVDIHVTEHNKIEIRVT